MKLKTAIQFSKIGVATFALSKFNKTAGQKYLLRELGKLPGVPAKLGQILTMRFDVDGQNDPHSPDAIPIEQIKSLINEYSPKLGEKIETIDPNAMTASIGQVHSAMLKDGRKVAIKIRYPGIEDEIHSQLDLIMTSFRTIPAPEKFRLNTDDYSSFLEDFFKEEVNYLKELSTQTSFRNAWAHDARFIIPEPIEEFSTDCILVQSFENSSNASMIEQLNPVDRKYYQEALSDFFIKGALEFGLIHTDLHTQNWGFRTETRQLVIYDFGATLNLSSEMRLALQRLALLDSSEPDEYLELLEFLGFDRLKLKTIRNQLPELCKILFEPVRNRQKWSPKDWNIQKRINELLNEQKWNFRTGGPPWFLMLIRGLNGWLHAMTELECDVPRTLLKVQVLENGFEKIALEFPSTSVRVLEEMIPDSVLDKILNSGISIPSLIEKAVRSNYQAQTLFDLDSEQKKYKVWIE